MLLLWWRLHGLLLLLVMLYEQRGRSDFVEPGGHAHVEMILIRVVPHEKLLPHTDVPGHYEVEAGAVLSHSQVLLRGVAG